MSNRKIGRKQGRLEHLKTGQEMRRKRDTSRSKGVQKRRTGLSGKHMGTRKTTKRNFFGTQVVHKPITKPPKNVKEALDYLNMDLNDMADAVEEHFKYAEKLEKRFYKLFGGNPVFKSSLKGKISPLFKRHKDMRLAAFRHLQGAVDFIEMLSKSEEMNEADKKMQMKGMLQLLNQFSEITNALKVEPQNFTPAILENINKLLIGLNNTVNSKAVKADIEKLPKDVQKVVQEELQAMKKMKEVFNLALKNIKDLNVAKQINEFQRSMKKVWGGKLNLLDVSQDTEKTLKEVLHKKQEHEAFWHKVQSAILMAAAVGGIVLIVSIVAIAASATVPIVGPLAVLMGMAGVMGGVLTVGGGVGGGFQLSYALNAQSNFEELIKDLTALMKELGEMETGG